MEASAVWQGWVSDAGKCDKLIQLIRAYDLQALRTFALFYFDVWFREERDRHFHTHTGWTVPNQWIDLGWGSFLSVPTFGMEDGEHYDDLARTLADRNSEVVRTHLRLAIQHRSTRPALLEFMHSPHTILLAAKAMARTFARFPGLPAEVKEMVARCAMNGA